MYSPGQPCIRSSPERSTSSYRHPDRQQRERCRSAKKTTKLNLWHMEGRSKNRNQTKNFFFYLILIFVFKSTNKVQKKKKKATQSNFFSYFPFSLFSRSGLEFVEEVFENESLEKNPPADFSPSIVRGDASRVRVKLVR